MRRTKLAIAVVLTGAMASFGVGCTGDPPSTQWEQDRFVQWLGTSIFGILYLSACQANGGVCPFPIAPSLPVSPSTDAP